VSPHPVSRYVPLLIAGDLEGLLELFGSTPRVNDPRLGWVEAPLFETFVAASHRGLSQRQARVDHLAMTDTAQAAVEECVLSLVLRGETVRLPVAIAAVLSGGRLRSVHIYHSLWPLIGAHAVRPPILAAVAGLVLPDVIGRHHAGLRRGDVDGVVRDFEADGYLREPPGEELTHRGRDDLRRYFAGLLSRGGVERERCSLTDNGTSCALEYNLTACGGKRLPSQAGLAVYCRSRRGLLQAARIYDDVEPPRPAV
jgi:hypothetical protein